MSAYGEDDRGRVFRWDGGLATWFRIPPDDDEYDTALSVLYGSDPSRAGRSSARVASDGLAAAA